jgi:hypothetical protein
LIGKRADGRFQHLFGQADVGVDLGLNNCIISSFQSQLHVQDALLELTKALLHGTAEAKQDERVLKLKLLLHCFSLLVN